MTKPYEESVIILPAFLGKAEAMKGWVTCPESHRGSRLSPAWKMLSMCKTTAPVMGSWQAPSTSLLTHCGLGWIGVGLWELSLLSVEARITA
jgi:hypothetical protein